jgi:hypothetical protein
MALHCNRLGFGQTGLKILLQGTVFDMPGRGVHVLIVTELLYLAQ